MKIYGHMVTRNETHRYLDAALEHLMPVCDEVFVYDDQSDDATVRVALEHGCVVSVRQDGDPTFLEHQGKFRQNGWDLLETVFKPTSLDWIICVDADEIVWFSRFELQEMLVSQQVRDCLGGQVKIHEIFDCTPQPDGTLSDLKVRTDGYWSVSGGIRMARYRPIGRFRDKEMGCGSVPVYAEHAPIFYDPKFSLLHLGYATCEDRYIKYQKFTNHSNHGHNPRHIKSILSTPTLQSWPTKGQVMRKSAPTVWRGLKGDTA